MCPACYNEEEDLKYMMTCLDHEEGFKMIEHDVTAKLDKYIRKYSKLKCPFTQKVLKATIFEYKDAAFPLLKQRNRFELTKGLISKTIVNNLTKLTSRKFIGSIVRKLIKLFHRGFKTYIWKPRCESLVAIEQNLQITKTMKTTYK